MAARAVLASPTTVDLVVYRGDSGRFRVSVTSPDGAPVDLTGATWLCQIRRTPDDTDVLATLDVTPVPAAAHQVDVVLSPAVAATLPARAVWDLQMTAAGDVRTLAAGAVLVVLDVSRA